MSPLGERRRIPSGYRVGVLVVSLVAGALAGCVTSGPPEPARPEHPWRAVWERALDLAAEDRPTLDRPAAEARLAAIVARLRATKAGTMAQAPTGDRAGEGGPLPARASDRAAAARRPAERLAQVLFRDLGFQGDPGDPQAASRALFDVDRVVASRRGTCLAVTVIGLAAAEAAGLETAPVLRPGHAAIACAPGFVVDPAVQGVRPATRDTRLAAPQALLAELLSNRAVYRRAAGDAAGARRDVERAVALAPDLATPRVNRAVLRLDAGDPAGALRDLERVERAGLGTGASAFNLGLACARLGRTGLAKHWYRTAAARDPARPEPWVNLAAVCRAGAEPVAAREAYQQALRIDPENAAARRGLAALTSAEPRAPKQHR